MVVAVLEDGLSWLTGARCAGTEEVECDENDSGGAEGEREHRYAREESRSSAGRREGTLAEAINGEGCGEEEGNEGKVVV
jgi:hypothetical protein